MSERMKRTLWASLGFAFCLLAVWLAVDRTLSDLRPAEAVTE